MTIRANGIIFLNDGRPIEIRDRLFTGEADTGETRNSTFNALLDGADCSVEFTNSSTGIIWQRRSRNGSSAIVEIDGKRSRKQEGTIAGSNHTIRAYVKDKGNVLVTWEPRNGVERL